MLSTTWKWLGSENNWNMMASSRRSASWGIAQKTASEKIAEKCFLSSHFAHSFSLAVFRAAPHLSNFLPEKILNKMLRPYARQPGKVWMD